MTLPNKKKRTLRYAACLNEFLSESAISCVINENGLSTQSADVTPESDGEPEDTLSTQSANTSLCRSSTPFDANI